MVPGRRQKSPISATGETALAKLLIAEDEERMRRLLGMLLSNADHELHLAADGREALALYEEHSPDLLITDLRMPHMGGMELIKAVREKDGEIPIIVITAFGSIEAAVDAMRAGATDFVTKPFEEARIRIAIDHALQSRELVRENSHLRRELRMRYAFDSIVVEDARAIRVLDLAKQVARTSSTVIVYGESGTGKELVSRAIHEASPRARGPFVALNCAAIPENLLESELFGHERGSFTGATDARRGRFEMADGGTLFLDEIGEMAPELQAKVLRALDTREFERVGGTRTIRTDIRVVAATNKDLRQMVAKGRFREDLFYRLNVFPLVLPPLRERTNDIVPLTEHFLARFAREMGRKIPRIDPRAEEALLHHRWMGNVRELQNVIERAMILMEGDALTPELLRIDALEGLEGMSRSAEEYEKSGGPSLGVFAAAKPKDPAEGGEAAELRWKPFRLPEVGFDLETHEKELIEQALERSGNNKTSAGRMLGLTRATMRYRLEKHNIETDGKKRKK